MFTSMTSITLKKRDNKLLRWVFEHKQIIFSHISSTQLQINIRIIVLGQNNNVHIQKSFLAKEPKLCY